MKTARLFTTLLLLACTARAGDALDLKLKWPVGSRFLYRMEMKQNTEMQPPGAPGKIKQDTDMTQEFAISSLKARENGGRELEMEIVSQKMEMKMDGKVIMTLDTRSPETANNPAFAALTKLIGVKLKYFTNPDGSVDKMEGFEELLATAGAGSPPQVQQMLKDLLGSKNMNQIATFGNQLPPKPVISGESWDKEIQLPMGPMGTFSISTKITYKGLEKHGDVDCALLETDGAMSSKASDKPGLMGVTMTFDSGKMAGKTWFDAAHGYPVETTLRQEFTLKMEIPQGADKEKLQMTMPMVQNISMKLVEVTPLK